MKLYTTSCVPLVIFLALQLWTLDAALYPGQTGAGPVGGGAPHGLSSGWTPPVVPPSSGMFQRPPPIQGFPSLANTDVSSVTNKFKSRFVPGYAAKVGTTTPPSLVDSSQTLTTFVRFLEGITTGVKTIAQEAADPSLFFSSQPSSLTPSSSSMSSSSSLSTDVQTDNPKLSGTSFYSEPSGPYTYVMSPPNPPPHVYSHSNSDKNYKSTFGRPSSPNAIQTAQYYAPAPPPHGYSARSTSYNSNSNHVSPSSDLYYSSSAYYQRPQNTHHPPMDNYNQNTNSRISGNNQYLDAVQNGAQPRSQHQRHSQPSYFATQTGRRYFSSSSNWPSYNDPQHQQQQQQRQQHQQQQQSSLWYRQPTAHYTNHFPTSINNNQQSSYNSNGYHGQPSSKRPSHHNSYPYKNYKNPAHRGNSNYNDNSQSESKKSQSPKHQSESLRAPQQTRGPTKAAPQSYFDILQAFKKQLKGLFPGGLPTGLDTMLNNNNNSNNNNNFNNVNSQPAPAWPHNKPQYQPQPPPPMQHSAPANPQFWPMPPPAAPAKQMGPDHHHQQQQQQQQQQQSYEPSMWPHPNQGMPPRGFNSWSPPPRKPAPRPPPHYQPYYQQPPPPPHGPPPQRPAPRPYPRQPAHRYHSFHAMSSGNECSGGFIPGQLCCDGIRNMIPPGGQGQFQCCHKGMYNMTSQVCCGDLPVPKPPKARHMLCCGTMLFDPRTHICCDKFAVPNQGGTLQCCRKRPFNPSREMCCGESVKPRLPQNRGMNCCGKHMYNPATHICCEEGNTFIKTPGVGCCGKNLYRPAVQQCCFGDALPKGMFCSAK